MNEKQIRILSVVATITAVCMYVAYIPQIQANLAGHKGSPWQPLAAAINCTLWVAYGLFKKTARPAGGHRQRAGHRVGIICLHNQFLISNSAGRLKTPACPRKV